MHKEILSPEQKILIPVLRTFSELGFFLVGGTAIALFLAHRRSIDFDLYFILKGHATLNQMAENADRIFGGMFNEKLFREQLSYFEDIDYSEKIDYLPGHSVDNNLIRQFLVMKATEKM